MKLQIQFQMNCSTCRFFFQQANEAIGQCRHNPPQAIPAPAPPNPLNPHQAPALSILSFFPTVQRDQWCGKHEDLHGDQ